MKHLIVIAIICFEVMLTTNISFAKKPKVMNNPLYSQMVVCEKSAKLLFGSYNMSIEGDRRKCKFEKTGLSIDSVASKGRLFWTPRYTLVSPSTKYKFDFQFAQFENTELGSLVFRIEEYTNSRKLIENHHILACDELNKIGRGYEFITSPYTKYIRLILLSESNTNICTKIDFLSLSQISSNEMYKDDTIFIGNVKQLNKEGKISLKLASTGSCSYRANLTTRLQPFEGNVRLLFSWIRNGVVVDSAYCIINNYKGVLSKWDGVSVEWFRKWSEKDSWISFKKENFPYADYSEENCTFSFNIMKTNECDKIDISIDENISKGGFKINEINVAKVK